MCMYKQLYRSHFKITVSTAVLALSICGGAHTVFASPDAAPTAQAAPQLQPQAVPPVPAALMPPTASQDPLGAAPAAPTSQPATPAALPPSGALPPASPTAPAATAAAAPTEAPSLGDVLNREAGGQIEQPAALPPGFTLPVEDEGQVAELSKEEKEAELRKKVFTDSMNALFGLKPEEVRRLLERSDEQKQAIEVPIYASPNPESAFITVSLDPGEKPPVVKTAVGHVTTLSMVDATGQPWPIQDLSWAGNFEVQQPDQGSNMLRITPTSEFAQGNVSMRMVGLNPPIILAFKADRENVHVRLDIQVPEIGPNGVAPLINGNLTQASAGSAQLASVLEGIVPGKARKMTMTGVDGRTSAYEMDGMMYVRTPYTLLSPAWNSSVRSADGTNVYALSTTPVLLLSDKGKMLRAYLSGEEKANGK